MVTVIQKDVVAVLIICLAVMPADVEIAVKTKYFSLDEGSDDDNDFD